MKANIKNRGFQRRGGAGFFKLKMADFTSAIRLYFAFADHHRRANGTTVQRIAFLHNTQHCLPGTTSSDFPPSQSPDARSGRHVGLNKRRTRHIQHRLQRQLNPFDHCMHIRIGFVCDFQRAIRGYRLPAAIR